MQKPYPRVWIPGVLSKETVIWTAQQRYPYIALNTSPDATKVIWDTYKQAATEVGYTAGPENFGYLIRVHVQDTEEKALRNARQFMWMQGEFTGLAHPVWANPAGYFSPSGRRGFVEFAVGRAKNPRGAPTFEEQVANTMIIAGTPDQVIERLKWLIEQTRPGIMGIWGNDGTVPKEDRRRCIELLCKEVMPAVREHGAKLGLKDPWEANAPVHLRYSTDIPVQRAAAE
jgi:alkanesulfonate monooxygenase SsuD/methylene tetrahydromethanopterin reductase-like flavin-dependent oxidoreductase (luciferase family)